MPPASCRTCLRYLVVGDRITLRKKRSRLETLPFPANDSPGINDVARSSGIIESIMPKDFAKWHTRKSEIDQREPRVFFHEREIWFCHLGANVGFEQDGKGDL